MIKTKRRNKLVRRNKLARRNKLVRRNKLIGGSLFSGSFLKTLNGIIGFMGFFIAVGTVGSIEMDRIDFTKGSLIALLSMLVFGYTVINYNYNKEKGIW